MNAPRTLPNLQAYFVAGGFILAGLFLFYLMGPIYGWLILLAVVWGCMLIGHPKLLLIIYAGWITVGMYVQMIFRNPITVWGDELLASAMLMVLFSHHIYRRIQLPELRPVRRVLTGLLALIVISALANQVPKLNAFHFVLQYIRFFLIFYYAYYFLSEKDLKGFLQLFIGLFLLQVAMNLSWLLGVNPLPNWRGSVDFAIGTGLGAGLVAYYCVAMLCVLFAYLYYATTRKQRWFGWILILITLFQLYFTFTFHAFLLAGFCLGLQLMLSHRPLRQKLLWVGRGGLILAAIVVIRAYLPASQYVESSFDSRYLVKRWYNMVNGPKGQSYYNNLFYLPRDLRFPMLGGGPGNVGSMVGRMKRAPLADRYFNWVDLSIQRYSLSEGGSIAGGPMTGILTIWSELGPVGVALYWGLFIYAFVRVIRNIRHNRYSDPYQRVLAEAFPPVLLMMFMLNIIADYLYMAFLSNSLWLWAAVVWTPAPEWKRKPAGDEAVGTLPTPAAPVAPPPPAGFERPSGLW